MSAWPEIPDAAARSHLPDPRGIGQGTPRRTVAVVGAGPGGLATAMLLGAAGLRVVVYEKADQVGGRTRVIERDGFRFDVGPTFFLYPEILRGIFERCGLDLDDFVQLRRVDPQYRLRFEGGPDIAAYNDLARLEAEIARIDPEDARNVAPFLEAGRRKLEAFAPILRRPFEGTTDLLTGDMLRAIRYLGPLRTVDQELRRHFRSPLTRLAFSFQTKYLGMSPFRCPSLFTILAHLEYGYGVWHPMGGCGAISKAMARAARMLGVEFRLGEPVSQIAFEGRRAVGVRTATGFEPAEAVVINADFADGVRRLIPDALRRRWSDRKIVKAKYSCSTLMLYLGIDGRYDELDHHTVFLSRNYERNVAEIEAGLLPTTPSVYVQNPSVTDAAFGTRDRSSLYVLVPVGNLAANPAAEANLDAYADAVITRLQALGLRDLRSRIRSRGMITPSDWRDDYALHLGATFSLSHDLSQMLCFRPRNRFDDVEGVYLAGGGTHPGSGLPVIYEGARISANLVLRDLGLGCPVQDAGGSALLRTEAIA